MKRFVSLILALVVVLSLDAIAEPATELSTGFGTIEDMGGWIAIYCNEWDDIFGSTFRADMSFDASKQEILSSSMTDDGILTTADVDGVIFDFVLRDGQMDVLSMRVDINSPDRDSYATLARCLAVTSVAFYDAPQTRTGMKDRFMALMDLYLDGLDHFASMVKMVGDDPYSTFTLMFNEDETPKGVPEMYFCKVDSGMYFSTHDLVS